jgi:lipopolysaccharide biosynthesis glycosyltransferase
MSLKSFPLLDLLKELHYRLLLQNLLINETKALYFDCDTLIYKDLTDLYNSNISDKYYVGQYEGKPLKK